MFQILNHIENARRRNCATNQNKKKISEISIVSCEKLMKKHR